MAEATARYLKIRPVQSSTLSFNMTGVIEHHNRPLASLGQRLTGFSLENLYASLGEVILTSGPEEGRLKYNAHAIRAYLEQTQGVALFSLRAHALATSLEQAICQRQNAFLRTYKHKGKIVAEYDNLFPPPDDPRFPDSKLGRLDGLRQRTNDRHNEILNAYTADGRTSVVRTTNTETAGTTASTSLADQEGTVDSENASTTVATAEIHAKGSETGSSEQTNTSDSDVKSLPMAYVNRAHKTPASPGSDPANFTPDSEHQIVSRYFNHVGDEGDAGEYLDHYRLSQRVMTMESLSAPMKWNGEIEDWEEVKESSIDAHSIQKVSGKGAAKTTSAGETTSESKSQSEGSSAGTNRSQSNSTTKGVSDGSLQQDAVHHPMDYGHPAAENDIAWHRRELDLQNERLPNALFAHRVPHLSTIIDNELRAIDLDIRQLQLNYVHTFLVSPLTGIITGIYKDLGESVQTGEAVLQLENDDEVLVVGRLNFRGRMDLGTDVKITTDNAFESGTEIELKGKIVAVRGHDADNDEYEVIFRCENRVDPTDPSNTNRKLPLNYTFDHKDVTVLIG